MDDPTIPRTTTYIQNCRVYTFSADSGHERNEFVYPDTTPCYEPNVAFEAKVKAKVDEFLSDPLVYQVKTEKSMTAVTRTTFYG